MEDSVDALDYLINAILVSVSAVMILLVLFFFMKNKLFKSKRESVNENHAVAIPSQSLGGGWIFSTILVFGSHFFGLVGILLALSLFGLLFGTALALLLYAVLCYVVGYLKPFLWWMSLSIGLLGLLGLIGGLMMSENLDITGTNSVILYYTPFFVVSFSVVGGFLGKARRFRKETRS